MSEVFKNTRILLLFSRFGKVVLERDSWVRKLDR
jgi:hypothetical protein